MIPLPAIFLLASLVSVPTRCGAITVEVPDGWRVLDSAEIDGLTPKVEPQTKLQERLAREPSKAKAVLAAKHDFEGTIAASIQVFCNPIPENMKYASSIELARVIAFASSAAFRAHDEIGPHEITVGDLPAAEWVSQYTMIESRGGSHAMKTHAVIVAVANMFYLIGYSGPAEDTANFQAFGKALKSIKIQRSESKQHK
jgi:hypothetical protein